MTAATVTPQVMRDRLLQAIDGQSNICNMVVVMEVISFLEKYPITKEALEETRLGKLINDVRKKTKNEDLAKRAKKLLRNWQKLIEPGKVELQSKGLAEACNGGARPCISAPAAPTPSCKTVPELKNRNDFNNCSPRAEKQSNRKRKGEQKEGLLFTTKLPQTTVNDKMQKSKQLLTNGLGGSSELVCAHRPLERETPEPLDKLSTIPIHAVKPHPGVQGYSKPLNASSLLKASILQQARQEQNASGGQYQPRSPRCSLHSPQTPKHEAVLKQTAVPAPGPPSSAQPFSVCVQGIRTDASGSADLDSQSTASSKSLHSSLTSSCSEGVGNEDEAPATNTEKRRKQKYKPKDKMVPEDGTRPVRLKDRRLTFDPVTGQIKPSCHKNSSQEEEAALVCSSEQWSDQPRQNPPVPASPFQQTDWKKLSRSEIIQSYLSQQSNMLTSSGAHTSGAHFFMSEFLKKEEYCYKDAQKTCSLVSDVPHVELPGVSREISKEDLNKLHTQHWSGVNGCYDTKGNWYDWTECISLDPHGDESRLNILPYVCLD